MTEREYIDTTNLCKVRIAVQIMRDYLAIGDKHDKHASDSMRSLIDLCDALEKIVATTE